MASTAKIPTDGDSVAIEKSPLTPYVVIMAIIPVLGTLLNVLNLATFKKLGLKDSVTLSFFYLAIFDLAVNALYFVAHGVMNFSSGDLTLTSSLTMNSFILALYFTLSKDIFYNMSALTMLYLAVMKAMCVLRPHVFRSTFTKARTNFAFLLIFIISMAFFFPPVSLLKVDKVVAGESNKTRIITLLTGNYRTSVEVKSMAQIALTFLTEVVTVLCVIILRKALLQSSNLRAQSTGTGRQEEDKTDDPTSEKSKDKGLAGKELQAVKQVTVVSVVYIVCNLCKILTAVAKLAEPELGFGRKYESQYYTIIEIRQATEMVNSSVNFFVYITLNSSFRRTFKSVFGI